MNAVLQQAKLHPVLIDIGASGKPLPIWKPVAAQSIYVGFDPDQREIHEIPDSTFHRALIVNKAITADPTQEQVEFFLTKSPYCSSTLPPNQETLHHYLYADLFTVEDRKTVPATTLDAALQSLHIQQIHWIKLDSQGTDLRIFNSISEPVRNQILAVDIEPGLIEYYQTEDTFIQVHPELIKQGFWLAEANVLGSNRVNQNTLKQYPHYVDLLKRSRQAPGWVEARYLRSTQYMIDHQFDRSTFTIAWAFGMLVKQYGYALDVVLAYGTQHKQDDIYMMMMHSTQTQIESLRPNPVYQSIKAFIPRRIKQQIKAWLR